jgi:predicted Ser/Thr protein kinase
LIGEIINGRYRLDRELGQGGMGTVYLAHDAVLDRHVALKLMSKPRLGTEGRSRLLVEARTVARMKHPNIVTVYDAGEVELQPYVVMEYIQGKTLNEYELDGFKGVVQASTQICAALQYAHEQDIIHRDLKPENIIIQPDGSLQLMDFGLAVSTSARMTEKGLIMGTVAYMSPEQAFGYEVSPASDLYSLGVILYELTTGSLPFEAENALGVITQHIHAPVVPPRAKNEQIPIQLNDLILSLLSKNPGDRPGSAAEVANILKDPRVLEAEGIPAREFSVLDRIVRGRIVGRQEEYEEALNLWRNVVAGQGQALLISGEPGIGKTRLVREIVTSAEVSGGWALVGECYAESNAPYNAFAQIIRQVLEHHHQNGLQLPDAVLDDLLDLTPELRYQYPDVIPNPKLDPESEQQRLFENMVALYEGLSNKTPLISVIDDAHWGDSGTLAMLHHLIRRTQHMPVMILATYREIELKEARPFNEMLLDLNRQRQGTRLKLNRLDRQATRELLEAIFAVEVSDEFLDGIYRETDGNPFFIEEVCRTLVESGALYYEDGQWHRPSMDELEIPQGVQVAVESRIAKLPKENQEVLRMASILGREFGFNILLEALDLDEDTTIEAIEAAEEAQMIQEIAGVGEVRFSFVHALVRCRTMLINHVRGMVKSSGSRLPSCTAGIFANKATLAIPEALQPALLPILDSITSLTQQNCTYDHQIETLCRESYPETDRLRRVSGVGPLTALAFVLTLEDPRRFPKSRQVGPALGLVPRRDQSGDHEPQLRIIKSGDAYLRQLLVNCAHYILGPFGPDCDLRRWGCSMPNAAERTPRRELW